MPQRRFQFAGRSLAQLADLAGASPAFVYSREAISRKVQRTRAVLPDTIRLHYSIKANPHALTVAHMAGQVDGMDVASHAEMLSAIGAGLSSDNISFSGPGKTDIELTAAVTAGIVIHAESVNEIERIAGISDRLNLTPKIAVRINPDFTVKQSGMIMGGGSQPFGIDLDQLPIALGLLKTKGIRCVGLHCYAGSQMLNAQRVCELLQQTLDMMLDVVRQHQLSNISINLGGGFGIPYFTHDKPLDIQAVGTFLEKFLKQHTLKPQISSVIIELGRYLVAESGVYVAQVIDKKTSRGKQYLVVEGGMNHHLAASGNLGQAIRRNFPVAADASPKHAIPNADTEMVSIVGPLCTPLDILASDVQLPVLQPGDYIAILNSGAYGYSASPHGFLSHPPPIELLL